MIGFIYANLLTSEQHARTTASTCSHYNEHLARTTTTSILLALQRASCSHYNEHLARTTTSKMLALQRARCSHYNEQDARTTTSKMLALQRARCSHYNEQDARTTNLDIWDAPIKSKIHRYVNCR